MMRVVLAVAFCVPLWIETAQAADIGVPELCKATVATVMGRNAKIIRVDRAELGIQYLSYVRDDGTLWSYRCKVEGNQMIWATDKGRWRTALEDGEIVYWLSPDRSSVTITEKYSDGTKTEKSFGASDF